MEAVKEVKGEGKERLERRASKHWPFIYPYICQNPLYVFSFLPVCIHILSNPLYCLVAKENG